MKKALLLVLALIAILPIALQAQDPFTLSVSEYMEMDDAERYAFNGYVLGLYQMSTPIEGLSDPSAPIRNCIEEWVTKNPDSWLLALNGWMYDAVSFTNIGSADVDSSRTTVISVFVRAIPQTCLADGN